MLFLQLKGLQPFLLLLSLLLFEVRFGVLCLFVVSDLDQVLEVGPHV